MAPVGLILHFLMYCFHTILPSNLLANYLLSPPNMAICVVVLQMQKASHTWQMLLKYTYSVTNKRFGP